VRHRATLSRPRKRRWLALGGLGAVLLLAASAPSASAQIGPIPLPGLPSLDPTDWAVKAVQAILKFFFGTSMEEIASVFVNLLLAVPPLADSTRFAELNAYRDYVMGAGWGLLSLSFIAACLSYWAASYTTSGAQEAARGFARTLGAIGLMLCFPIAFGVLSDAVNALTAGLIANDLIANDLGDLVRQTLTAGLATGGGLGLLVGVAALVIAIALLIVKVRVTS
jgi:hypothetical protein